MFNTKKITVTNVFLVLFFLALAIQLGVTLLNYGTLAHLALNFRYPLDYGEGPLLDQTLRMLGGENIYHNDFSKPPYTISNYPPLFLLVQLPFAKIFGPAFWYGRGISFVSALLAALLIGLTLYTLTRDWMASAVGGLFLLVYPYIQYWSLLNRIDTLALVLSWAAVFIVVRWYDRRWGIPVAALFFILSVYTRQTYALAAPAAVFIWLLVQRQWRKAFQLALLVGGSGIVLFLLINLLTHGGFYLNIVKANVNPFYWNTVKWNWEGFYKNSYILMALIGIYLVGERFTSHTRTWPLVLPYLIGAALSGLTIGKDGSNVNYLYELAAAMALGTGASLAWFGRKNWLRAAFIAALFFQVGIIDQWTRHDFNGNITGKTENEAQIAQLAKIVSETDGIVLTDEYMGLVPLAGKRLYFQPFEYKMLAEGGVWDQEPFLEALVGHKVGAILLYNPSGWDSINARWTRAEQDAIWSSYDQDSTIADTIILRP